MAPGPYAFRILRDASGAVHVWLVCPRCGTWAMIDDDQLHGRVSAECPTSGCGFHETVDFFGHLSPEQREAMKE